MAGRDSRDVVLHLGKLFLYVLLGGHVVVALIIVSPLIYITSAKYFHVSNYEYL